MEEQPANKLGLAPKDVADREELKKVLNIMKRQGAIGETQSIDYEDALAKKERDESRSVDLENREGLAKVLEIEKDVDLLMFDFDGVIRNSDESVGNPDVELIKEMGAKDIPDKPENLQEYLDTYQAPYDIYYRRFRIDPERAYEVWRKKRDELMNTTKPDSLFPEVLNVLQKIKEIRKQTGLRVAIVSASSQENVNDFINKYQLSDYFDEILGGLQIKSESIAALCAKYNIKTGRALFVGDLPSDIKDARKIADGVNVVAVARRERALDRLGAYDPDFMVISLDEIFSMKRYDDLKRSV